MLYASFQELPRQADYLPAEFSNKKFVITRSKRVNPTRRDNPRGQKYRNSACLFADNGEKPAWEYWPNWRGQPSRRQSEKIAESNFWLPSCQALGWLLGSHNVAKHPIRLILGKYKSIQVSTNQRNTTFLRDHTEVENQIITTRTTPVTFRLTYFC